MKRTPTSWFTSLADDMCEIYHLHEETPVLVASIDRRPSFFSEVLPGGKETGIYVLLPGEAEANAAFIVRACNAHDDLVAALEDVLSESDVTKGLADWWVRKASAALAKAKGGAC